MLSSAINYTLPIRRSLATPISTALSRSMSRLNTHSIDASMENDVLFQNINNTKIITLNRPTKLNSLNQSMLDKIYPRLIEFFKTDSTHLIIQNSNGRAFCAGGDVTSCVENNLAGFPNKSIKFFQEEYSMNYLLATYNKPIVSIMNGITMGGGVGLSIHTPFRIATENTKWAMPEMDIGFSPDVGTTFALNKIVSSSFGWYLALTGENLSSWDVYFSGLATHYIPSSRLNSLQDRLTNTILPFKNKSDSFKIVNNIIEEYCEILPSNYKFKYSSNELKLINEIFRINTNMETIFEELSKNNSEFALKTLETLKKKSPLSLKVALELLQRGSNSNIYLALTNELNAANQFMQNSDFNEAVSTKLIKKLKTLPNWKYKNLSSVPIPEVLKFFKQTSLTLDKHFNITFNQYPYNFGLPKISEIENYINGKNQDNKDPKNTNIDQIINYFKINKYGDKIGLENYLNFILNSRDFKLKSKL